VIISHKHKFIFFAVPKTGTHSIRFALRPYLGSEDEEHVRLFHKSKLKIEEFKDRINGHISVKEIRPHINDETWNGYFKFAFVRNPFDRFVSSVFYKHKTLKQKPEFAKLLMKRIIDKEINNTGSFYKAQTEYLVDSVNHQALDFIGRTESMQFDFDKICDRLKIPHMILDYKNMGTHDNYQSYYDDELMEKVSAYYRDDINHFSYIF
jgi:hypothetical protein